MKLYVQVVEARDLVARDLNGFSDPFVRLSLGSTKARTSVVYKNLNPSWNEDFFFTVTSLDDELKITVWDEDRFTDDFLGQTKVSVADVLHADKKSIARTWYPLQKKSEKSKVNVTGAIMLDVSLFGRSVEDERPLEGSPMAAPGAAGSPFAVARSPMAVPGAEPLQIAGAEEDLKGGGGDFGLSSEASDLTLDSDALLLRGSPGSGSVLNEDSPVVKEFHDVESKKLADVAESRKFHDAESKRRVAAGGQPDRLTDRLQDKLSGMFLKKGKRGGINGVPASPAASDVSQDSLFDGSMAGEAMSGTTDVSESSEDDDEVPLSFFQDDDKSVGESPEELPPPLSGGVLVDQNFMVSMKAMNALLFKPGSLFTRELGEAQKTSELVEKPWKKAGNENMKRSITYRKAPSKLLKSVMAYELQTYLRADDRGFALLSAVSTPEVPYGKCFVCELLFLITPGSPLPTGESTCHLNISWRMNFLQSTMMKGMIQNGAAQGLKESYTEHQKILTKYAKPLGGAGDGKVDSMDLGSTGMPKTDWELAREYFGNYTVLLTFFALIFMLVHLFLVKTKGRGINIWMVDLPDSIGEIVVVAILTRQAELVGRMVQKFFTARLKASDHGVKAQGDGWLLTVSLVEAKDLYSIDADGSCDPYVVFTCNGKLRTSSVILSCINPKWEEVYEFDATEDPPSTMDVEVFDYDGPFSQAESLGHTNINFLKSKPQSYADVWLPLSGQTAQARGSKLHLRVSLSNTRNGDVRPEYMKKVEKEAGTKIVIRSPQRNTQFQKLFSIPQEEFLINDYACAIKRKIPIQGRLFLSPRMLGFYSNLFGHKTKFSMLWEDIEEIKEGAPTRGVLFNPSLTITLRKGRGLESRQGSKGVDHHGRLRFQFLSFVRPGAAMRTIIALWKNRTLSVEQTMELIASVEEGNMKYAVAERQLVEQADDAQPFLGLEEAQMSLIEEVDMPATLKQLSYLIEFGALDHQILENLSVNNYKSTQWEIVGDDPTVKRRQVTYVMSRLPCRFGSAITAIQQRAVSSGMKNGVFEELITLHDVPFGDHFLVQVRRVCTTISDDPASSHIKVYAGVAWQKNAEFQKKITKNILRDISRFLKQYTEFARETILKTPPEVLQQSEPVRESTGRHLPSFLTKMIKTS